MEWLRDGLAKLLQHAPQDTFTDAVLVVFFDVPMVYRYHKGRIYDKPLTNALDPQFQLAYDVQQDTRLLHAESLRSPYSNTPFVHQYLHVYALPLGLLLVQQADYLELDSSMPLLLQAISLLLEQRQVQETNLIYNAWLTKAGMNKHSGELQFGDELFTPYPAPVFSPNADGFYPYHALGMTLIQPYSVIEVLVVIEPTRLFRVHPTWYVRGESYYMSVPSVDKRVINRVVNHIQKQYHAPFEGAMISVARSSDPMDYEVTLQSLRHQETLYYPPVSSPAMKDVMVAMAATKRYKIRNHTNQWVADYFVAPTMTLACERDWLVALLNNNPPRTRYVTISNALANHPDTVPYFKQHRMGAMFQKTCVVAPQMNKALASYLQEKNAIIGSSDWNTFMNSRVDVFFFDHVAGQDDETLLDYLYERQMTKGVTVIFPVRNQQDALWLINHNVGLFYKEDGNE